MQLIRLRLELCNLLILGGSNCDLQLDPVGSPDRWVKGLIESAVNVVGSYPGFLPDALGWGVDRRRPTRPAFRHKSDSIKDSKQQEVIEKESR
jgi:hypothetical protein